MDTVSRKGWGDWKPPNITDFTRAQAALAPCVTFFVISELFTTNLFGILECRRTGGGGWAHVPTPMRRQPQVQELRGHLSRLWPLAKTPLPGGDYFPRRMPIL